MIYLFVYVLFLNYFINIDRKKPWVLYTFRAMKLGTRMSLPD